jgi:hypothetical protein
MEAIGNSDSKHRFYRLYAFDVALLLMVTMKTNYRRHGQHFSMPLMTVQLLLNDRGQYHDECSSSNCVSIDLMMIDVVVVVWAVLSIAPCSLFLVDFALTESNFAVS